MCAGGLIFPSSLPSPLGATLSLFVMRLTKLNSTLTT